MTLTFDDLTVLSGFLTCNQMRVRFNCLLVSYCSFETKIIWKLQDLWDFAIWNHIWTPKVCKCERKWCSTWSVSHPSTNRAHYDLTSVNDFRWRKNWATQLSCCQCMILAASGQKSCCQRAVFLLPACSILAASRRWQGQLVPILAVTDRGPILVRHSLCLGFTHALFLLNY